MKRSLICTLAIAWLAGLAASAQSASPQIQCQITLSGWCIANFDGRIDMTSGEHNERVWTLQDRLYMPYGPMRIIERAPNCAAGQSLAPRKLHEKIEGAYVAVAYSLVPTDDACSLVFQLPLRNGVEDGSYRQTMHFQIMIAGRQVRVYDR
jgi:hypothetical protein